VVLLFINNHHAHNVPTRPDHCSIHSIHLSFTIITLEPPGDIILVFCCLIDKNWQLQVNLAQMPKRENTKTAAK
jgi:hypothetical protein